MNEPSLHPSQSTPPRAPSTAGMTASTTPARDPVDLAKASFTTPASRESALEQNRLEKGTSQEVETTSSSQSTPEASELSREQRLILAMTSVGANVMIGTIGLQGLIKHDGLGDIVAGGAIVTFAAVQLALHMKALFGSSQK